MPEKYEKVLDLMKQKGGRIEVDDPDLKAILGEELMYRVSVYFSFIRRFSKLEVNAERKGRKVVAYSLVKTGAGFQNSKYLNASDVQAANSAPASTV